MEFETRAIHAGQDPDPATGAIITPIYQTTTYVQEAVGVNKGYDYSRASNPTRVALEEALASLEGAEHGIAFSSGLGATTTLLHLIDPGERVVLIADVYGGVYRMTSQIYEPKGYKFTYVPAEEFDESLASHLGDDTRLVWIETPSNPLLNIVDIRRAAETAHAAGALVAVDNTFASPYLQQPLDLGADVVLHSTTKYLGGHSDVIGGAVVTSDPALAEKLRFLQKSLGAVPGPFDAWLVLRGLKTSPEDAPALRERSRRRRSSTPTTPSNACSPRAPHTARVAGPPDAGLRRHGLVLVESRRGRRARGPDEALRWPSPRQSEHNRHPARWRAVDRARSFAAPRNLLPLSRARSPHRPLRRSRDCPRRHSGARARLTRSGARADRPRVPRLPPHHRRVRSGDGRRPCFARLRAGHHAPAAPRGPSRARPRAGRRPPPLPLPHPSRPCRRGGDDRPRAPAAHGVGLRDRRLPRRPVAPRASARRLYGDVRPLWGSSRRAGRQDQDRPGRRPRLGGVPVAGSRLAPRLLPQRWNPLRRRRLRRPHPAGPVRAAGLAAPRRRRRGLARHDRRDRPSRARPPGPHALRRRDRRPGAPRPSRLGARPLGGDRRRRRRRLCLLQEVRIDGPDGPLYDTAAPYRQSWQGLARYWAKKRAAAR